MQSTAMFYFALLIIAIAFYFWGVVFLSKRRPVYSGLILPCIFLLAAIYNLIKPMIIYNPHPTMEEGMLMTFFGALSIAGFVIFAIIFVRRNRSN